MQQYISSTDHVSHILHLASDAWKAPTSILVKQEKYLKCEDSKHLQAIRVSPGFSNQSYTSSSPGLQPSLIVLSTASQFCVRHAGCSRHTRKSQALSAHQDAHLRSDKAARPLIARSLSAAMVATRRGMSLHPLRLRAKLPGTDVLALALR